MTETGLSFEDINKIQNVFERHNSIEEVVIFGSRAKGTFKPYSDIDLTLIGKEINLTQLNTVEQELDELNLPYKFDISIYRQIKNEEFLNHIKRVEKQFYKRL
ncbi:MAG: nucleotidyltransferase domain-containing protein [Balneolales bacterium]|nr:nucleotidyltransferase domain-containing protein [Balneolales bacterium]